ncbi:hypothetical protein F5J12DRAFT_893804 [Pisolithus orientalis]|uniref:uncharacterized protein n=1 Tax=Pisolithus orientalis TaxID=936130 RepID=UPI002224CF42|nr:uncharacterized protein F5J12DRAFT_893804 [Pisolithus orientalis]KAI6003170.1 hypothetical protein F5J12DRAFT_893804 [Pisolithus orientalis]
MSARLCLPPMGNWSSLKNAVHSCLASLLLAFDLFWSDKLEHPTPSEPLWPTIGFVKLTKVRAAAFANATSIDPHPPVAVLQGLFTTLQDLLIVNTLPDLALVMIILHAPSHLITVDLLSPTM